MITTNNPRYLDNRITKDGWVRGALNVFKDHELYITLCRKYKAKVIPIAEDWYKHFKHLKRIYFRDNPSVDRSNSATSG